MVQPAALGYSTIGGGQRSPAAETEVAVLRVLSNWSAGSELAPSPMVMAAVTRRKPLMPQTMVHLTPAALYGIDWILEGKENNHVTVKVEKVQDQTLRPSFVTGQNRQLRKSDHPGVYLVHPAAPKFWTPGRPCRGRVQPLQSP